MPRSRWRGGEEEKRYLCGEERVGGDTQKS